MKKTVAWLLLLFLLAGAYACALDNGPSGEIAAGAVETERAETFTPSPTPQDNVVALEEYEMDEWEAAKEMALIPKNMPVGGNITAGELYRLLQNAVMLVNGDTAAYNALWRADYPAERELSRIELCYALASTAGAVGLDNRTPNRRSQTTFLAAEEYEDVLRSPLFVFSGDTHDVLQDDYASDTMDMNNWAMWYCVNHGSLASENALVITDDKILLHPGDAATRKDAILGAYRLLTSFEPAPEYINVSEIGLNSHTIPAELLTRKSSLPEIRNSSIPRYNGVVSHFVNSAYQCGGNGFFSKQYLRALKENGVNFISLWYSFGILGAPDFGSGVNLRRLEELDDIIAWCIEYDVHLCIEMNGLPETGGYPRGLSGTLEVDGTAQHWDDVYNDETTRELTTEYWGMLARRYANVPACYLSFNLMIEAYHESAQTFTDALLPMVKAIRTYNEDRVVFVYGTFHSGMEPFAPLADYGCPIALSFYEPWELNYGRDETYPLREKPSWPAYGFYAGYNDDGGPGVITVKAEGVSSLTIGFAPNPEHGMRFELYTDGERFHTESAGTAGLEPGRNDWRQITVTPPVGMREFNLMVTKGALVIDAIVLDMENGNRVQLNPHDNGVAPNNVPPVQLTVAGDGSVTSNLPLDFDALLSQSGLDDMLAFAEEKGVGVLIAEWGIWSQRYGENQEENIDAVFAYTRDMLEGFSQRNVSAVYNRSIYGMDIAPLITKDNLPADFFIAEGRYIRPDYTANYYVDTWVAEMLRVASVP